MPGTPAESLLDVQELLLQPKREERDTFSLFALLLPSFSFVLGLLSSLADLHTEKSVQLNGGE